MYLALRDKRQFVRVLHFMKAVNGKVFFDAWKRGLHLRAIDDKHISIIKAYVPSKAFSEYLASGEKLMINGNMLLKALSRIKGPVSMSLNYEGFMVANSDESIVYSLRVLDDEVREFMEYLEVFRRKLKYDASLIVDKNMLKKALDSARSIGAESIYVGVENDYMSVNVVHDDTSFNMRIKPTSMTFFKKERKIVSKYDLKRLMDFLRVYTPVKNVHISFGRDFPISLSVREKPGVRIEYVLAPIVKG